ncbi:MAG: NTP transferase domain-containing protein, partial [Alphaproteobacteria bacterium]|nr:NTP transferase domain-containing protein [Alphaproteobacteria bacterium]
MADEPPLPPFAAIVVAGGKGLRVGGELPKQYRSWRGRALLAHSVEALREAGASPLVVVIADGAQDHARAALRDASGVRFVTGGASRQDSVVAGLEALEADAPARVLIHDAARPDLPRAVIERLLDVLSQHPGAIPVLPVVDSLAVAGPRGIMADKAERE